MRTGGEILISHLAAEGIRHVFTVPGESFIAALEAMHANSAVRPITCRNESGAAIMAEATGKLTGRPGVALVTRGPGAANAVAGVYAAAQANTPMLLLVGLPARALQGMPAFQAIDLKAMFGGIAKWVGDVSNASHMPDLLARAFRTALSGRRGPVVLGLPEDVLFENADVAAPIRTQIAGQAPQATALEQIKLALAHAERPLVIAGGSEWSAEARQNLAIFAERFDLPVVTSFRRQDHFDNRHRCYAGHCGLAMNLSLAAGLRASDVVIALGTRLGDITTQGFTLLNGKPEGQTIIHISGDAGSAESDVRASLTVPASAIEAISALAQLPLPGKTPPWGIWRRDLNAAYLATLRPLPTPGDVQLEDVITILSQMLPADAIIASGAGNYAAFLHRYFVYKDYPTQLAPISGSMGYGLPAAIAAKLVHPERTVVALAGDGCLQMTSQELVTAVQFALPIIVIVANNGTLGTIRMHQERHYPGHIIATTLMNPNFVAWARSCGATGERVDSTDAFAPALSRAIAANRPAVIELTWDLEALSPEETLASIRAAASKQNEH